MTALHIILIIASLAGFGFVLYRELKHDWKHSPNIDHRKGWIRRFLFLIPSMVALGVPYGDWWAVLIVPFLLGSLWFLLFDGLFNLHYNRSFFHVPKPHPNSAMTDKALYPLPVVARALLKVGLIGVSVWLYLKPFV